MLPVMTVTGNVALDPALSYVTNGTPVCNVTVYCNGRISSTPQGEKHTERVRCTFWGKQAEAAAQYIRKGQPLTVSGEATTEAYLTRAGTPAAGFKIERCQFYLIATGDGNDRNNGHANGDDGGSVAETPAGAPAPAAAPSVNSEEPPF